MGTGLLPASPRGRAANSPRAGTAAHEAAEGLLTGARAGLGVPLPALCGQAALSPCPPGHLVGRLRLTLEASCLLLLSGQASKTGIFWNVPSSFEAVILFIIILKSPSGIFLLKDK